MNDSLNLLHDAIENLTELEWMHFSRALVVSPSQLEAARLLVKNYKKPGFTLKMKFFTENKLLSMNLKKTIDGGVTLKTNRIYVE